MIVRGVIVVGSMVSDINSAAPVSHKTMPPGDVRGIDVRTGKQLWLWHSIPGPGEVGNETWLEGSWSYSGNTNVWGPMSGDEELGYVYLPETTPTNDWVRRAAQRAPICLLRASWRWMRARASACGTSRRFTTVSGTTISRARRSSPTSPSKDGESKRSHSPRNRRCSTCSIARMESLSGRLKSGRCRQGDVPGEWYSPTQPMPLDSHGKPFAYDTLGVNVDDLIDFTPELRAEALKILEDYAYGPMFYPIVIAGQGTARVRRRRSTCPAHTVGRTGRGGPRSGDEHPVRAVCAHAGRRHTRSAATRFRHRPGP